MEDMRHFVDAVVPWLSTVCTVRACMQMQMQENGEGLQIRLFSDTTISFKPAFYSCRCHRCDDAMLSHSLLRRGGGCVWMDFPILSLLLLLNGDHRLRESIHSVSGSYLSLFLFSYLFHVSTNAAILSARLASVHAFVFGG